MNEQNVKVLQETREKVSAFCQDEYILSDGYMTRWLQYKNNNTDKAALGISQMLKWRREHNIDNILQEDFSEYARRFPMESDTVDQLGRPVIIFKLDKYNLENFEINREKLLRFSCYTVEIIEKRIKECWKETNGVAYQSVIVVDCYHMSTIARSLGTKIFKVISIIKDMVGLLHGNYPRGSAKAIVLNASKWFTFVFAAVKCFLCEETIKAHQIYGIGDKFDWKKAIYEKNEPNSCPSE